jgi:hypothetical protein
MIKNEKYSHKSFTNISFKDVSAEEFNNTRIVGSCFAQEVCTNTVTQIDIFPTNIFNVTFEWCNLINVYIPLGCIVGEGCSTHKELSVDKDTIINVDKDSKLSKQAITRLTRSDYAKAFDDFKKGVK